MQNRLWLPASARAEREGRRFMCGFCPSEFADKGAYIRHTTKCAERNSEVIDAHLHARESNAFTGVLDKEKYEWVNDVRDGKRKPMRKGIVVK